MTDLMEAVTSLAKRRGFAFPSSEIYGGLRSSWDYGPLGVELRNNIRRAWWRSMVQLRDDVVGLEAAILMSPRVWEASGHVAGFSDPLVECLNCHQRFRQDQLPGPACPNCGQKEFTEPRQFNLMFKTHMGPVEEEAAAVYLRPETAQAMFVDFRTIQQASRMKVPFGIAQIGKAFRNEITPSNFVFRTREFELMEVEYFVEPGADEQWFEYWKEERLRWFLSLGVRPEKLRLRAHASDELAHYAKAAADIEYEFPFGWSELEGIANRTDFDLRRHQEASGETSPISTRRATGATCRSWSSRRSGSIGRSSRSCSMPTGWTRRRARRARWRSAPCSPCIGTWRRSRWPSCRSRGTRRSSPRRGACTTW